jgi:two-component system LytT family response regulator
MKVISLMSVQKIAIKVNDSILFIPIDNVMYVEANDNYSNLFCVSGEQLLVTNTLKFIEDQLLSFDFIRCHRSFLVNPNHIKELNCKGCNYILMLQNKKLPISRVGYKRLKTLLGF